MTVNEIETPSVRPSSSAVLGASRPGLHAARAIPIPATRRSLDPKDEEHFLALTAMW